MTKATITFTEAEKREDGADNVDLHLEFFNEEGEKVTFDSNQVSHQLACCVHTVTLKYPEEMANLLRRALPGFVDEE